MRPSINSSSLIRLISFPFYAFTTIFPTSLNVVASALTTVEVPSDMYNRFLCSSRVIPQPCLTVGQYSFMENYCLILSVSLSRIYASSSYQVISINSVGFSQHIPSPKTSSSMYSVSSGLTRPSSSWIVSH